MTTKAEQNGGELVICGLTIHPACAAVPESSAEEYQELLADIREHGFDSRFPVILEEETNLVLDGRTRLRACDELGVTPMRSWWRPSEGKGDSPVKFVLRAQRRRSITSAQRAALAAKLLPSLRAEAAERMTSGNGGGDKRAKGRASEIAAAAVGSNRKAVELAVKVQAVAPDVFQAMEGGTATMAQAKAAIAPKTPPPPMPRDAATDAVAQAGRFSDLLTRVHALKREVLDLAGEPVGREIRAQQVEAYFQNIAAALRSAVPHAACACGGKATKCKACDGSGWLTKAQHERQEAAAA